MLLEPAAYATDVPPNIGILEISQGVGLTAVTLGPTDGSQQRVVVQRNKVGNYQGSLPKLSSMTTYSVFASYRDHCGATLSTQIATFEIGS